MFEDAFAIFGPIIASLASGFAAAVAIVMLVRKQKAQSHYLDLLRNHKEEIISLRNEVMHDGKVSDQELEKIIALLHSYSNEMPESEQKLVHQGLLQDSQIGRELYCEKIFRRVGAPLHRNAA